MPDRTTTEAGVLPVIRLDASLLRGYLVIVLVAAVTACVANAVGRAGFALPFLAVIAMMVATNLFTLLATGNLTRLLGALPVRRATVMRAHYLTIAGTVLLTAVPWIFGWVLGRLVPGRGIALEDTLGGFLNTVLVLVMVSILIPCTVKWGPRVGALVSMVIVFVGIAIVVGFGDAIGRAVSRAFEGLTVPPVAFLVAVVVATLVAYVVSCAVATRIYERQDH